MIDTIVKVCHMADTVYKYATLDLDKKTLIKIGVTTGVIFGISALTMVINKKTNEPEANNENIKNN